MASPTLLSLDEALRQAGVEIGELLCPLLFLDDGLESIFAEHKP